MNKTLISGSTIGILGGGQLGQMLSMAAARLGFKTHIFEPSENPPASNVASKFTRAEYDDYDALKQFASSVDVVTYEFENIPTAALDIIETQSEIFPNREASLFGKISDCVSIISNAAVGMFSNSYVTTSTLEANCLRAS